MRLLPLIALVFLIAAPAQPPKPKRLEAFSWDAVGHVLTIHISEGRMRDGKYVVEALAPSYTLHYDFEEGRSPVMAFGAEVRKFSVEEAKRIHQVMEALEKYCTESVEWWEAGKGEPAEGHKERARR